MKIALFYALIFYMSMSVKTALENFYTYIYDFHCDMIVTKAIPEAADVLKHYLRAVIQPYPKRTLGIEKNTS